jgi:hypothetical protein
VAKKLPPDIAAGKQREAKSRWAREDVVRTAEIGLPPDRNDERWDRYRFDLFRYLTECFPHSTGLKPFSLHHRRIIERLQQLLLEGGMELFIVFRGWSKSTIAENSSTWVGGYGHRNFIVPIGANDEMARIALDSIQSEFEQNDHLMEIFPAACHAARALEGVPQRAGKQTIGSELTHIEWTGERCILPTYTDPKGKPFEGGGAIIWPKGITSNLRGLRFKRPDGKQARPDFYLIDDIQTDDTAASPAQNNKRLSKINKSILRGGGHHKNTACALLGTIIEPDDALDQLSNPKLFPAWRTTKVPMLLSFSKAQDSHWLATYAELRTTHNPDDDDDKSRAKRDATAFYAANRDVMDEGALASWEHCYIDGEELSAIQHAYNIIIDTSFDAFMAECQSSPVRNSGGLVILTPEQICAKQSDFNCDQFPAECVAITCFVDVHPSILYWEAWAWEPTFTGYCINYGTFPDQHRKYFAHSQLSRRLQHLFPGMDTDATVTAGLDALILGCDLPSDLWAGLKNMEWSRSDGTPMRIAKGGIDANGEAADAVKKAVRRYAPIFHTSFGKYVGAKGTAMSQWNSAKKSKCNWPEAVPVKGKAGEPQGYLFDTNYAKTRFHRALALPRGSKGALYLYKTPSLHDHRRVADHWYAEKAIEVTVGSRTVYEFTQKPGTDNHDLDCGVGSMVAAGVSGISSVGKPKMRTTTKSPAEWMAAAKGK